MDLYMNQRQKNYLHIAQLYRLVLDNMCSGTLVTLVNIMERYAYGQSSEYSLRMAIYHAINDEQLRYAINVKEVLELLYFNTDEALKLTIRNIASQLDLRIQGLTNKSKEQRLEFKQKFTDIVLDHINKDEVPKLSRFYPRWTNNNRIIVGQSLE